MSPNTPNTLNGRVVAITGSTGGLGSAVAQALRERGALLAPLDLDAGATSSQAAGLGGGDVARGWAADVRDYSALESAVAAAAEHFGWLDVVVANAGVDVLAPMSSTDPVAFERVVDINLTGVWRTFQRGAPVCAGAARLPDGDLLDGGVRALTDAGLGVEVGTVHPTFFRTPMGEELLTDPAGRILWDGGERGVFKTVPQHQVVDGILRGIERRARLVIVPRSGAAAAMAPGLLRPLIERVGFRGPVIERAIAAANR